MGSNTSSTLVPSKGNNTHTDECDSDEMPEDHKPSRDSKRYCASSTQPLSEVSGASSSMMNQNQPSTFKPHPKKSQSHTSIVVPRSDSSHPFTISNPQQKLKTRPNLSSPSLLVSNTSVQQVPSPLSRSATPITHTSAPHQQHTSSNHQVCRMSTLQKSSSPSSCRYVEPTYSPDHSSHQISQYSSRPNVLSALPHNTAVNKSSLQNENESLFSEEDLSTVMSSRRGSVFSTTTSEIFSLPSSQSFLSSRRGSIYMNGSSNSGFYDDMSVSPSNHSSEHLYSHQSNKGNQDHNSNDTMSLSSEENCIILNNKSNRSLVHSSSTNSLSSLANCAYQPSPIQTLFQKNKLDHCNSEKTITSRYGSLKSLAAKHYIHSKSVSGAGFTSLFNPSLDKNVLPEIPLLAVTKPIEPPCFSHLPRSVSKRCQQQARRSGSSLRNKQYLDVL
ncbi:hypothetical protein FDP41_005295 [Naegleria fowleri]|uniref:Uncharacterized protein n=1 Tax=Naegleria fowleri TaxID=5763 RepID=A0A6A5BP61_NAEFO|nr:uncharacterized protein FDP41_005295 [Naegleria fowleri]KAF0975968.1 hypothetical protein FDP41_005295 [Naegleria fowleri]CAG4708076.1 unnamed protein product [Naegleria fowleri]